MNAELRAAEDDLARYRRLIAKVTDWLNNPAHDRDARETLAQLLELPAPAPERTPHHG